MKVQDWIEGAKVAYHPEWIKRWREDAYKVPPLYVEISPVGMCNHRCTFCAPEMLGYPNRQLDLAVLKKCLAEMKRMREEDQDGLGVRAIQYAGEGEPTLHQDLGEIITATREAGIDVGILTNGTGLSEKLCRQIVPLVNGYIQVSMNAGTAESYRLIHRTPTKDHFDLVWRNLDRLVEIKYQLGAVQCELGVNMTVLVEEVWDHQKERMVPSNWQEMELLAKRARDSGLDYVSFKPYSQHLFSQETAKLYGRMTYQEVMEEIYKIGEDLIEKYSSPGSFEVIFRFKRFEKYEQGERGYVKCYATPTLWSYIQSDGTWISCSAYWTDERFHLGNIKTQMVEEIWYGERRRQHLDFVLNKLDISECRKTCHPDMDNEFLYQAGQLSSGEFSHLLGQLRQEPKPKRGNFI